MFYLYVGFTVISIVIIFIPTLIPIRELPKFFRIYVFAFIAIVYFSKIIGLIFLLMDDLIRFFRWGMSFIITAPDAITSDVSENTHTISRLKFLNYIALGMTVIPFSGFLYGMVKGAFDYKIHRVKISLPNLPSEFNGLKIIQLSDIHAGSFLSTEPMKQAVKLVMKEKADLIFFTGDLVNNEATEMQSFMDVLNKLNAPMGIYSTLGNHDYGDYIPWESADAKKKNLNDVKEIHKQLGWRLLMNEHVPLTRGSASIALLGVENWGANFNFPKYGDLKKAHAGSENYPVKLLLSHDPSHWDKQIRPDYSDIDITFSGHTHGSQVGIEIPGLKWSPSQYFYKEWAGLYKNENQYIYVNRGLGFLGYPGRVGILPEITVVELLCA